MSTSTNPTNPSDADRHPMTEAEFESLARRAGDALRYEAPADGAQFVQRTVRRRRTAQVVAGVATAAVAIGGLFVAIRPGGATDPVASEDTAAAITEVVPTTLLFRTIPEQPTVPETTPESIVPSTITADIKPSSTTQPTVESTVAVDLSANPGGATAGPLPVSPGARTTAAIDPALLTQPITQADQVFFVNNRAIAIIRDGALFSPQGLAYANGVSSMEVTGAFGSGTANRPTGRDPRCGAAVLGPTADEVDANDNGQDTPFGYLAVTSGYTLPTPIERTNKYGGDGVPAALVADLERVGVTGSDMFERFDVAMYQLDTDPELEAIVQRNREITAGQDLNTGWWIGVWGATEGLRPMTGSLTDDGLGVHLASVADLDGNGVAELIVTSDSMTGDLVQDVTLFEANGSFVEGDGFWGPCGG